MIASKNEYFDEASETIFRLSADEQIRKQCRDREEYYQDLRSYEKEIARKDADILSYEKSIAQKDADIRSYEKVLTQKDADIRSYENTIAQKDAELAALKAQLAALQNNR